MIDTVRQVVQDGARSPLRAMSSRFAQATRMKPDTLVIVHPVAGGGRPLGAERLVASCLAAHGCLAEFVRSRSLEDVRELAAWAAGSGFRYVVALGGDGAFQHLIEGLNGTEAIAGFFPAGNGNDVARSLGIPADPVRAADSFLHSRPRTIDLVRVTLRDHHQALYAGACGMGLEQKQRMLRTPDSRNGPA